MTLTLPTESENFYISDIVLMDAANSYEYFSTIDTCLGIVFSEYDMFKAV